MRAQAFEQSPNKERGRQKKKKKEDQVRANHLGNTTGREGGARARVGADATDA
jgi:hypothetical protein